jgi:hypothetical protein
MSFGASKSFFEGKTFVQKEFDKTWAIKKDTGTPDKVVAYSFDVSKIRGPIDALLSKNKWKPVLVASRKDAPSRREGCSANSRESMPTIHQTL